MRTLLPVVALPLFFAACGGGYVTPTTPTTATTPPPTPSTTLPPSNRPATNWMADAVVTAVVRGDGGPCGWGTSPGETRAGVEFNIKIEGSAISMDEDMPNWPTDDIPYKGTLSGNELTVAFDNGPDWLKWTCQWRGATLSGRFSDDRSTFDATEKVFWGTVEAGTTVTRRWSGRAVQ
jgi:hypothetical protein